MSRCKEPHGEACRRRRGTSIAFVDPREAAPRAPVVWMSPIIDTQVEATTDRLQARSPMDFSLARLPPMTHLLIDADGVQHFVLKSPDDHATVHVTGSLAPAGPVRIKFESVGVDALSIHRDTFSVLTHLLHPDPALLTSPEDWPVERLELRDSLIALDGKAAGATHWEIATVILGSARVDSEWPDLEAPIRYKIKRDLARGRRLMNGGYRDLLKNMRGKGA